MEREIILGRSVPVERQDGLEEAPTLQLRSLTLKRLSCWLRNADKSALVIGFIGYTLSPFSPYNDVVVNIAPSYFLAVLTARMIPLSVGLLTATYYVLSNLLGIFLLWLSLRKITRKMNALPSWKQAIWMLAWVALSVIILSRVDPAQLLGRIGLSQSSYKILKSAFTQVSSI